ncbi:hypothetical protein NMU03_01915 [Allocoprobacillus halotolerans]|uniref:Thioredoxin n=1 Tax=Allocoprobacillus halotolerans TaxID=2944914 RepID=A0ABY5I2M0_9FIRM|nr:hypothetical protein [Allocoprobacillus halotolerans]UTY39611.1 hypothetical protein NMU03_01915 [Allocoprobacillus halotolerans]
MKKVIVNKSILFYFVCLVLIILSGCVSTEVNKSKAEIKELNFDDLKVLLETNNLNNDLLQISLENCTTCEEVKEVESENINNYDLIIYNYTLNRKDKNYQVQLDYIYSYFPDFKYAPSLFVKNSNGGYSMLSFENNDNINESIIKFIESY